MKDFRVLPVVVAVLCMACVAVPASASDAVSTDDAVTIRRTIPNPRAVQRAPLTSDQLSTTSTRLIDARRGHRPFSTVHRDRGGLGFGHPLFIGYDDHFGITRPENRPYSYAQRTPRTGVSQFRNREHTRAADQAPLRARGPVVIVRDERSQPAPDRSRDQADMTVRIHRDKPELPTRSGAVIITADGTVIQVGG